MSLNEFLKYDAAKPYLNVYENSCTLLSEFNQLTFIPGGNGATGPSMTINANVGSNSVYYEIPSVASNSFFEMSNGIPFNIAGSFQLGSSGEASGYDYFILGGTGGRAISLPSVVPAGQKLNFTVASVLAGAYTIAAGSAIIYGSAVGVTGIAPGGGGLLINGVSNLILGTTSKLGDNVLLLSNGTNWFAKLQLGAVTSLTTS